MASIFEICDQLEAIARALENGVDCRLVDDPDNTPEMADEALDLLIQQEFSTREQLHQKIDGYCDLINDRMGKIAMAGNEIARLQLIKRANEAMNERLRSNLHFALTRLGLNKVETGLHKVSLAKKPKSVEVDEFQEIPAEFLRVTTEVNRTAIKAALESGKELPFAKWAPEGTSLRVK